MKIGIGIGMTVGRGGGAAALYTISGTVYDGDGSTAVEGATVALGELSAVSAANGTFTISDVPSGTSGSMTCTLAGYSWTAKSVSAMSGNLTAQNYTNAWWATGGIAANCVAAYQPVGAANLAASYVNLVTPGTHDLTAPVAAPTWSAREGWKFNGIDQYLLSDLVPATGWGWVAKVADMITAPGYAFGAATSSTTRFWLVFNRTTPTVGYANGGSGTVARCDMYGVYGASGTVGYNEGQSDKTGLGAWSGTGTNAIVIGAVQSGGSVSGYGNCRGEGYAFYSTAPTADQQLAIRNALRLAVAAPTVTLPQNLVGTPAVVINFDDGDDTVYTLGHAYTVQHNCPLTQSVISSVENTAIEVEELLTQQDTGWMLVNHTDTGTLLTTLTEAQQETAITNCQTFLENNGMGTGKNYLVAPSGATNEDTETAMTNTGIVLCRRSSSAPYNFDLATADILDLNACNLGNELSLAQAKAVVDTATANDHVVIFYGHQLVSGAPATGTQWDIDDFKALIDYCIAQGAALITMHDLYRLKSGAVAVAQQV